MRIDLNADLGEECGDDAAIMPCLSSVNIACGAHAGGPSAIEAALALAARHGVTVGAHVSYEDRANFGRVDVSIDGQTLAASLREQIALLQSAAARLNLQVRYVKPHGALYHRVGIDAEHADALIAVMTASDPSLELLGPASKLLRERAGVIPCRQEFFADRGYDRSGRLVERGKPGAHVSEISTIVERTRTWLRTSEVMTVDGTYVVVEAQSICLHGDSAGGVNSALAIREALTADGYRIANWMHP